METVRVSAQFQIVIPPAIRKALKIQPAQSVHVIQYNNRSSLFLYVRSLKRVVFSMLLTQPSNVIKRPVGTTVGV